MSVRSTRSMASGLRGFTLLEVMIALVIVGGVGLGMVAAVASDARASFKAAAELEALAIAEEVLAQIETMSADQRTAVFGAEPRPLLPPWDRFTWHAQRTDVPGQPGLVDVAVVVTGPKSDLVLKTRRFEPTAEPVEP